MTAATLTITRHDRDVLFDLLRRREIRFGYSPAELARSEGITCQQLCRDIEEERRLRKDLAEPETFDLTMSQESLATTLKRLHDDAERAREEDPHRLEPRELPEVRRSRLASGAYICNSLVERLDSLAGESA